MSNQNNTIENNSKNNIIVLKLKDPVGEIEELHIRTDVTFGDYFGIELDPKGKIDFKTIAQLGANLTNQPLSIISKLKKDDWLALTENLAGFF